MALVPHANDPQHKEYVKDKAGFLDKREHPGGHVIKGTTKNTSKDAGSKDGE